MVLQNEECGNCGTFYLLKVTVFLQALKTLGESFLDYFSKRKYLLASSWIKWKREPLKGVVKVRLNRVRKMIL